VANGMSAFTSGERDQLIVDHVALVRTIAGRLARRLPSNVDVDELVSVGTVGLIDAIDRFEPARGVPFKSYAEIRVRGSMVDHLRESDFVPRAVRRKFDRIETKRMELRNRLGRMPDREEMAKALELSVEEYDDLAGEARIINLVPDAPLDEEGGTTILDQVSNNEPTVEDLAIAAEVTAEVLDAIGNLPDKERTVLQFYYLQGANLKDIGATLGVTESRACQLAKQGLSRMRVRLKIKN
jgi:RNA polymerase sigma factor for flagellar operon FliA